MAERDESPTQRAIIVASAAIMGLIAIATAWSGFESTKWSGNMTNTYASARVARSESSVLSVTANQEMLLDIQLFIQWINAIADDDSERADFYFERMRDEAKPAMEAWLATEPRTNPDAPPSPFAMPDYALKTRQESEAKEEEATSLTKRALEANQNGDNYVMTTVILASGLFFAGISTRFRWPRLEVAILVLALAAFAYAVYQLASYPVLT